MVCFKANFLLRIIKYFLILFDYNWGGGGGSYIGFPICVLYRPKLQALVYDILPSTTAVFSYAIGSRKLSANEQFFCFFLVLKQ